jgi:Fe-S cluster biogenesis protein NfuA
MEKIAQTEDMESRVQDFIKQEINPELLKHCGWIELDKITNHDVYIRFRGACHECASIYETFHTQVEPKLLQSIPDINQVIVADEISEEMMNFAQSLFTRHG